uniref:Uncharacterized protein n=1 Tax=Anguilla anguilla TaxID=7936 RepID=A0A0E9XDH8_ANGAN
MELLTRSETTKSVFAEPATAAGTCSLGTNMLKEEILFFVFHWWSIQTLAVVIFHLAGLLLWFVEA